MDDSAKLDALQECVTRLTVLMEESQKLHADHEGRLREIESKNGQAWEKAVWIVIGAAIAAALTVLSSAIGL